MVRTKPTRINSSQGSYSDAEAFITTRKQRLKQFNGKVYLNDGDNFEVEIFNPLSEKVLAKIKMDGKYISNAGIVLRPGERVFLERYLDSNNKFVFKTYTVSGDSKQVAKAIKNNGTIEIEFFKEQWYSHTSVTLTNNDWWNGANYTGGIYYNQPFYGGVVDTTASTTLSSINASFTNTSGNTTISNDSFTPKLQLKRLKSSKKETGRVEKGEASNQSFANSFDNFQSYSYRTIVWQILPLSEKVHTASDLNKVYCTNCGTRIRKASFNFCPNCGGKVIR